MACHLNETIFFIGKFVHRTKIGLSIVRKHVLLYYNIFFDAVATLNLVVLQ